ncbi:MAG: hypothetical protein FGM33_03115, partial [Candidatus Kapabacteria bacterium]|nr:hypothetical protein [Candidatus Kapabacteria bacterium]
MILRQGGVIQGAAGDKGISTFIDKENPIWRTLRRSSNAGQHQHEGHRQEGKRFVGLQSFHSKIMTMTPDKHDRIRRVTLCRQQAAWVMRPRRSVIRMTGADRIDLLHRLTTNDMRSVAPGSGRQTVLLTEKARIIDVVTVLQDTDDALLIGSADTSSDILSWIRKYVIMDDVRLKDLTDQMSMIEIMGPRAADVTGDIVGIDVSDLGMSQWRKVPSAEGMLVVRTASPSELSYLIIAPNDNVEAIVEELQKHSAELPELDEELDEYVRVLAGMGLHGKEWTLS